VDALPLIDVSELRDGSPDPATARAVHDACRRSGFFRVVGHGIPPHLVRDLDRQARRFFALPEAEKDRVAMRHAGAAWRGWFPLGGELTSGRPDQKEGLYFGVDHPPDHPGVAAGRPLHGPNLYPERPTALRPAVEAWMAAATALGRRLLQAIAAGLGLEPRWFERHVTAEPTVLFRIFRYPPTAAGWGVAEHTDYGLLTILAQDGHDGLEVRGPAGWVPVPGDPEALVVNLGDMLERLTGGRYLSTPHRVRHRDGDEDRLSFPCFLDPSWDAVCPTLPGATGSRPTATSRWDGADPRAWEGTYGDYLTAKVARVFPTLHVDVAPRRAPG
jgi:isopenicillin N synthase-like dioxygenase